MAENESMRSDFEDAFNKFDGAEEEELETGAEIEHDEGVEREDETVETAEEETAEEETTDTEAEQDSDKADSDKDKDSPKDRGKVNTEKAPASWTPAAREHWKKLPPDVQKQVATRERQIMDALENGKVNRKTGENFNNLVQSYQPIIAAEGFGHDPIAGFKGLLESIATLRMGNPQQKAEVVSRMIKGYGVDIDALDTVLSSQISGKPAQQSKNAELEALLNQKLAPMQQFMSSIEQQKMQAQEQMYYQTNQEVADFASSHEFYEDVRMQMADLIDVAANNGRMLTMEQAYNAACASDPEISKVMQQRSYSTNVEAKRNAASSIRGKQGGSQSTGSDSLRDALMNAIDS